MAILSNEQKQLLFDYCLGLTLAKDTAEAERLISSDKQAAQIHSKLKAALAPLEAVESESCPDELAEKTISRINELAGLGRVQLQHLLADEQAKNRTNNGQFWLNFSRIAAVAAVIIFAISIWTAPLDSLRHKYWRNRCQMQMANIFQGLSSYISDHEGEMPAVATNEGQPWWKVGYKGTENYSNTRNMWLLVKGRYVKPVYFVCPGSKRNRAVRRRVILDVSRLRKLNDFPGRSFVTYSSRIRCDKVKKSKLSEREVLISDLNPLFEKLPKDHSKSLQLKLDKSLFVLNSINHNRRGQNVLFCSGSVRFLKKRYTDTSQDDIFTLQEMSPGYKVRGCEWPSCESDTFLAA